MMSWNTIAPFAISIAALIVGFIAIARARAVIRTHALRGTKFGVAVDVAVITGVSEGRYLSDRGHTLRAHQRNRRLLRTTKPRSCDVRHTGAVF